MNYRRIAGLFVVAAVLAMLFVALNPQHAQIELLIGRPTLRLGVALSLALALGMLVGVLMRAAWVAELLAERGRLRRALKTAEAKIRQRA